MPRQPGAAARHSSSASFACAGWAWLGGAATVAVRTVERGGQANNHESGIGMSNYETLLIEPVADHVVLVTLNRPASANALNTAMGLELFDYFEKIAMAPGDLRCVIVTGAGDKAFCAGGDLKQRHGAIDPCGWRTGAGARSRPPGRVATRR